VVLVIVGSNFDFLRSGLAVFSETITGKGSLHYGNLWRTSALLFWAFIGWENVSFSLEEFKSPKKSIPQVFWMSYLVVIVLYLGITITSIGAEASGVSTKGASGLTSLVDRNPMGFFQMAIMVLVIPANAIAWVLGASRLYYASGRDGILPSFLGRLSPNGIPLNSLLLSFVVYTVAILAACVLKVSIATLVLLVSQNFLMLYLVSIFAYWKTEKGPQRWFVTALAGVSCGFLLSGFSWWIIYSLALLCVGYLSYRRKCVGLGSKNVPRSQETAT
jgi:amino acid transporter